MKKRVYELTPAMVAASAACCSTDPTRDNLSCGHIRPDGKFEACNGYMLAVVSPADRKTFDVPDNGLLIHRDNIKEVGRIAKKENATVHIDGESLLISTETTRTTVPMQTHCSYPDTAQVRANREEKPTLELAISADVLLDLAQMVIKSTRKSGGTHPIKLTLYGEKSAVEWESHNTENGEALSGVIMPCRF